MAPAVRSAARRPSFGSSACMVACPRGGMAIECNALDGAVKLMAATAAIETIVRWWGWRKLRARRSAECANRDQHGARGACEIVSDTPQGLRHQHTGPRSRAEPATRAPSRAPCNQSAESAAFVGLHHVAALPHRAAPVLPCCFYCSPPPPTTSLYAHRTAPAASAWPSAATSKPLRIRRGSILRCCRGRCQHA